MKRLFETKDWSRTHLGPREAWPQSLKTAVDIMLNSRYPMFLWWGRKFVNLYNDAYCPILGKRHPAAMGEPARSVWKDIWPEVGPLAEKVMREGEASWNEDALLIMERNGYPEETYFTFSYSPVFDEQGKIAGVFCACTEETDRVVGDRRFKLISQLARKTASARTEDEACQAISNVLQKNAKDIVFAKGYLFKDGGVHQKPACRLIASGPENDELFPQIIDMKEAGTGFWPLDTVEAGQVQIVRNLSDKCRIRTAEWPQPVDTVMVLPLMSRRGIAVGFLILGAGPGRPFDDQFRTFAELLGNSVMAAVKNARAYAQEKHRAETFAQLDRAKTTFFSNISHEFRTPLTLLLSPLEDLLNSEQDSGTRQTVEMMRRNGSRLLKLVNTLLDFARLEAGRLDVVYEETDLTRFTRDLAGLFRSVMEKAGLRYRVECEELPEPFYVDRTMWEKIVMNLLSNALKYTLAGEVRVQLCRKEEGAELSVRDTGVGIAAENQRRVFERFHRLQTPDSRTQEGAGIGLSLVRELAGLHGGDATLESTPGKGSIFRVTIPSGSRHLPEARIRDNRNRVGVPDEMASFYLEEAMAWISPESGHGPGAGRHLPDIDPLGKPSSRQVAPEERPRILVVDDNADMRAYLSRILAPVYDIRTVSDGSEALSQIKESLPSLVLADIMIPKIDGMELLRRIRKQQRTASVPVMLLSAKSEDDVRVKSLKNGADDFLTKPFSSRELLARVESALNIAKIRRDADAVVKESEENFRVLANNIAQLAWIADNKGNISWYNKRWYDYTGTEPKSMKKAGWQTLHHPRHADRVIRKFREHILEGKDWEDTFPLRSRDGSYGWFLSRAFPVRDGEGKILRWFGTNTDITELINKEKALRHSERRFRDMADAAPVLIWEADEKNQGTYFNKPWLDFTGRKLSQEMGQGWLTSVHPDDREKCFKECEKAFQKRSSFRMSFRLCHHSGEYRWVLDHGIPRFDAHDRFVGYIGSCVDITDQKRAEDKLRQLTGNLETQVEQRTKLARERAEKLRKLSMALIRAEEKERSRLAQMLHDHLQQILVAAKFGISYLKTRLKDQDGERDVSNVDNLVEEAIQASRSLTSELRPTVLSDAQLPDALEWLARWMNEKHHLAVNVSIKGTVSPVGEEHKLFFFQSARELLFNVVKHAGVREASVCLYEEGKKVYLEVRDEGKGFESSATSRDLAGGFGLFHMQERAESLGGNLEASSVREEGSVIRLGIPVDSRSRESRETKPVKRASGRRTPVAAGIRTLIVDDHKVLRQGLINTFKSVKDIAVIGEAADGEQAVEQALKLDPDVVIMDISMPRMNGVEATRQIVSQMPGTVVIGLSLHDSADMEKTMLEAGAGAYISKVGPIDELVSTIRNLCRTEKAGSGV